jgi:hypothetical protein
MWNSKPKRQQCNCRNRRHGNPKLGTGPCRWSLIGDQRSAVVERIAGKRAVKVWLAAARAEQLDDVED